VLSVRLCRRCAANSSRLSSQSTSRRLEVMPKDNEADPTPEQIKHLLQQAILRDYPNPERKGCLDSSILTAIAQQRLPHEDAHWARVSHCSPCYQEFLDNRKEFR